MKNRTIRVLCPKLLINRNESLLQWLIGSPFLPPLTIVSTIRCIHGDSSSPDYHKESEDIRTLLLKGFDVIGALVMGDSDFENKARKALDAARRLRKLLSGTEKSENEEMIGAVANSCSGGIHFFISKTEKTTNLEPVSLVVHDDNPEKYVWENGCLLRCQLPIKLPFCFPVNKPSDADNVFLRAIEVVIANFKDPKVAYIVESSSKTFADVAQPVLVCGAELSFGIDLPNVDLLAQDSEQKLLRCAHFCSKSISSPASFSAENADVLQVSILFNRSEKFLKFNSPVAEYFPAMEEARLLIVDFKLEVICYAAKDLPLIYAVSKLIIPGLVDQLNSMKEVMLPHLLTQHPKLHPYHFNPSRMMLHPVTVIYELNYGETEMKQVDIRKSLHLRLGLPFDRPLLRITNALDFSTTDSSKRNSIQTGSSLVKDVHTTIPSSSVSGGITSLVQGSYEYYHYLQDGLDDSGWGCAYRSLQTIISWFRLQHYTSIDVPSHREIQLTLVDIGDKDHSFIGSREWIGAIELSFVLDKLLGISSKVINVMSGAELPEKCRELALHFENQGTPIMIGGGVLAYTLLGVDYNEASGDCAFLILDPHYTGTDDLKKIVNGGWCGWKKAVDSKGKSFFLHDNFYNLLLPQRPNMV
ncbi:hypothetical protein SLEP1_g6824 [Rubroshorea leprosula]|uniref:Probable Ufm1-specific protease n=1 Tax=Rubroshorea leprosula TaxID=152421 RepID=A0AAV5I6F8_9ROSI|nr:hypothetical protein SLEP1_g6824 [Rubroshorea leprosula]